MKKLLVFLAVSVLLATGISWADVIDAPHTQSQGVFCIDCHSYSIWWQFSPSDQFSDRDEYVIEPLCDSCHDGNSTYPYAKTHSGEKMGSFMHRAELGNWSRACLDCHSPHFQEQLRGWRIDDYSRGWSDDPSVLDTDLYLVQGTIGTIISNDNATSIFDYSVEQRKELWASPVEWSRKTGVAGRGLMLIASTSGIENSFEVLSATEEYPGSDNGSLTVNGVIDSKFNGAGFGLIYGQLIRKWIKVDPDQDGTFKDVSVKFFDGKGGFVDDDNGTDGITGICQVCHSQTYSYTFDLQLEDGHNTPLDDIDSVRCTTCHDHDVAFGHGTDGGSFCVQQCHNNSTLIGSGTVVYSRHEEHLALELVCTSCHDIRAMRIAGKVVLKDGKNLAETNTCSECHHDGTLIGTASFNPPTVVEHDDNATGYKDIWLQNSNWNVYCYGCHESQPPYGSGSHDNSTIGCDGCHGFPPLYSSGSPKGNSHLTHTNDGKTCDNCHSTTMADAVQLIGAGTGPGVGNHTNDSYDVVQGPGFTFSYTYAKPGGTCSAIGTSSSCHLEQEAVWGDKLDCINCHLGNDDVEGIMDDNLVAKISGSQWASTGHGLVGSSSYSSGNPGANLLSCEYCHTKDIRHGSNSNPFRLVNFTIPAPNDVCWVCHKTDSLGYDPDPDDNVTAVNSLVAAKVDSYHGYNDGLGGKFCWDCHDPHGDSNIYMVHDRVALRSDRDTGKPTLLSSSSASLYVDFKDSSTGAGYAKSTPGGPFNGLCNVCHLNTKHYTSTSGDGHYAAQTCSSNDCHPHSNPDHEDKGFTQGECLDCHYTAQPEENPTRRAILPEFPATTETAGSAHAHFGGDLDSDDCRVCHYTVYHGPPYRQIILWGGDKEVKVNIHGQYENKSIKYVGDNASNIVNLDAQGYEDISDFCMSCHDEDGMNSSPYPFDPFGNDNNATDVASRFKGTRNADNDFIDTSHGIKFGDGRPVLSHHPLSRYDQELTGAKIECTSCHNAHSASLSTMLANPDDTSKTWGSSSGETANLFCLKCHDGGSNPHNPGFPAGIKGPVYSWPDPLVVGEVGDECYNDGNPSHLRIFDCKFNCVLQSKVNSSKVDSKCDNGYNRDSSGTPINLLCDAFGNDDNACGTYVNNDNYSQLKGLETCEGYSQPPWDHDNTNSKIPWSKSAHGGGTKRLWPGYSQPVQQPAQEVDCIDCHEHHGSYKYFFNEPGNPYMLRDYIDGSKYVDDGNINKARNDQKFCDDNASRIPPVCEPQYNCDNSTGTPLVCEQFGTSGDVIIDRILYYDGNNFDQDSYNGWTDFCSKCHDKWRFATGSGAHNLFSGYSSCLTCHAHGTVFYGGQDNFDYPYYQDPVTYPEADPDNTYEVLCP